jgi:seryl-tRNA synthetase
LLGARCGRDSAGFPLISAMIDTKLLRETPDRVKDAIAKKGIACDLDAILELDASWRHRLAEVERLRAQQKAANHEMAALPKGTPEFLEKVKAMKEVSAKVKEGEAEVKELEIRWKAALLEVPNLPHESVPLGRTPEENVDYARWGEIPAKLEHHRAHWEIAGFERIVDFGRGSKVTGAGFPFYIGDGARMVRALIQFFLHEAGEAGYEEVHVPILVNAASATATGQLPDKEGQMYETAGDSLYAVPTAEVPLTNFFRDEILEQAELPVRRAAYSPCFRREAGSYGKDVRGLNRLHQFDKVELVKWVHPDESYAELESLRLDAERLLQKLGLPYRTLLMCTGDLGFAQAKKYDLEVWAVGQQRWLEVSSCSNFESFQARRAGIRYRDAESGKIEPVHTLNGSGLAVPRVLVAILENYLQPDGSVLVPEALRPWMGKERIGPFRG